MSLTLRFDTDELLVLADELLTGGLLVAELLEAVVAFCRETAGFRMMSENNS